uniref:Coronin n=1 Tax=Mesocestoides corti TaxID=53468 RepID=A0A5K3FS49_MESCO
MAGIRQSKFKHVLGRPLKRAECYECIPITRSTHDTNFCAVNPKYLAIITESSGGGGFTVIPIEKVGRMPNTLPMVAGHTAAVIDIQWCPHNNDIIASGSEDCTIKIWQIPDGGIGEGPLTDSIATLIGHQRRVNLVMWHPTAQGVLASAGADNVIILWNTMTQSTLMSVELPNSVTCLSFNYNGSKLAACCKDGKTRILNPRTGDVIHTGTCHEGKKPQMCVFLGKDRLFTTGFSKMSERQLALWDSDNLSECLWRQELDITNGVLFPFYDIDTNLIFVCGKGDSTVRYFEYCPDEKQVYYLSRYDSTDPQRGFAFMPKLGLNVSACEIARMYKLHNKNWCEVIPFTVPRKSGLFQEDLYPDTVAPVAALSAEDWFNGNDADPIKVSVKEASNVQNSSFIIQSQPTSRPMSHVDAPTEAKARAPPVTDTRTSHSAHLECAATIEQLSQVIDKLVDRVKSLEARVLHLEGHGDDESDDSESEATRSSTFERI